MKKVIKHCIFLACFLSGFVIAQTENKLPSSDQSKNSALNSIYNKAKDAAHYLFSCKGATDIACAYSTAMGITLMHELGHSIAAKLFWGKPINITLGAQAGTAVKPYLQVGGIKLGGFNPYVGYADVESPQQRPLDAAVMCAAGPICGTISSLLAYRLLKKSDGFYCTKVATLYSFLSNSLYAAITGITNANSDFGLFISCLKEHFNCA